MMDHRYLSDELKEIIKLHAKFLAGKKGGKCADLRGYDLNHLDLRRVNLSGVNMSGCDLSFAQLTFSKLRGCDFSGAKMIGVALDFCDLSNSNMSGCDLHGSDISNTNMSRTNLSGANMFNTCIHNTSFTGANLSGANINKTQHDTFTAFFAMCCPEKGSFTAFSRCGNNIVELLIPEDARRSSATSRLCRADKAHVVAITNLDGTESELTRVQGDRFDKLIYTVGEDVLVPDFDDDRWAAYAAGIHFYITRDEAAMDH